MEVKSEFNVYNSIHFFPEIDANNKFSHFHLLKSVYWKRIIGKHTYLYHLIYILLYKVRSLLYKVDIIASLIRKGAMILT